MRRLPGGDPVLARGSRVPLQDAVQLQRRPGLHAAAQQQTRPRSLGGRVPSFLLRAHAWVPACGLRGRVGGEGRKGEIAMQEFSMVFGHGVSRPSAATEISITWCCKYTVVMCPSHNKRYLMSIFERYEIFAASKRLIKQAFQ